MPDATKVLLALALAARLASAQADTGAISGKVSYPSGAVLPGASIAVQNIDTNETFHTETGEAARGRRPARGSIWAEADLLARSLVLF